MNKKASNIAAGETIYWIIAIIILIALFFFIGKYIAKPLIQNFADNLPNQEPEHVLIEQDYTSVTHKPGEAYTFVARIGGKPLGRVFEKQERDFYLVSSNIETKVEGLRIYTPDNNIYLIYDKPYTGKWYNLIGVVGFARNSLINANYESIGMVLKNQLVIYQTAYLDNNVLKYISYGAYEKISPLMDELLSMATAQYKNLGGQNENL